MNGEKLFYSLFQQNSTKQSEEAESIESIRRLESSVFNSFSARRNAARIDHYFVNLHSSRFRMFTYAVAAFLTIFAVVATLIFTNKIYINFINTNSVEMMDTIHNRISTTISSALAEPQFFSNIFAHIFEKPELIVPKGSTAPEVTQMLNKANIAGSRYIISWDIGLPWGELISIETYSKQTTLLYCNTTYGKIGDLRYWPTDQNTGKNISYPTSGGIFLTDFNATNREWYRVALSVKSSTWTDIYESQGSRGKVLMVSSVTPSINNGTITSVVSMGIGLEVAQKVIISQQPSNNSRLALTNSGRTVLALTGDDKLPTNEFTDLIVTKQLDEIEDYIWKCVTNHPDFEKEDRIKCNMNSKTYNFHVSKEVIEPAPGVKWLLWSVLCMDDFVGNIDTVFRETLIYTLVVVLCLWIFLILGSILLSAYIESMQNRILGQDTPKEYTHHVKSIGVIFAIQELKKLRRSHADNLIISTEIDSVIDCLQSPKHELLYNRNKVYKQIANPEVKNALVGMYGVPPSQVLDTTSPSASMTTPMTTTMTTAPNTNQGLLSFVSNEANQLTNQRQNGRLRPVASSISSSLEANQSTPRCCPLQISPDLMRSRVLMICLQCNARSKLFNNEDFHIIIEAALREIGDPINKFATDSIDFLHTLCRKFDGILNDPDSEMALLITSIVWHLFMKERNSSSVERIHRYFLTDSKEFKIMARNFLLALFVKRVANDDYNHRWDSFSLTVMSLVETAPISLHHTVIAKFALMSKWVREGSETRLSHQQIITFIQLLFNFSMVSFFFHPEQFRVAFSRILNPDYDQNPDEINNFSHCIFSELVDPTVSVLRCICEPQFFLSMRCE